MLAASCGSISAVRKILEYGADVDAVNDAGQSALLEAIQQGALEIVDLLILTGSDINLRDHVSFSSAI